MKAEIRNSYISGYNHWGKSLFIRGRSEAETMDIYLSYYLFILVMIMMDDECVSNKNNCRALWRCELRQNDSDIVSMKRNYRKALDF